VKATVPYAVSGLALEATKQAMDVFNGVISVTYNFRITRGVAADAALKLPYFAARPGITKC
jgi:hypothetical protein